MVRLMKNEWFVRELGDGTLSLVAGIQNRAQMHMHKTRQWIMFHGLTRANMREKRVVDLRWRNHTNLHRLLLIAHDSVANACHGPERSCATIVQGE